MLHYVPRLTVIELLVMGSLLVCLSGCRLFPSAENGSSPSGGTTSQAQPEARCPLDNAPATKDEIARPILAVMVENSPAARPQTGLDRACVVYEAITEGGITRFMAVYLHDDPAVVGPVRSARPHFIYLSNDYDAALVHCGESYEALQILVITPDRYNIDQLKVSQPFWRDRARKAPHNLYTSIPKLRMYLTRKGWADAPSVMPKFSFDGKMPDTTPAAQVNISFGGAVHYRLQLVYDATLGGYVRYMDGKLHVDKLTGKPLVMKNVIIQRVAAAPFSDSQKGTYDVNVLATGEGQFLSDGHAMPLRWTKTRASEPTSFTDDNGSPFPCQPGQTWVELVPNTGEVTIVKAKEKTKK